MADEMGRNPLTSPPAPDFHSFRIPLSLEAIPLTMEEYYGRDVVSDKEIAIEWSRIPHFYNAFYVYKYATGLTVAVNIVKKLLAGEEGFAEKYIRFLSSGGSKPPIELLDELGIQLTKKAPFNVFIDEFKESLDAIRKL